MTKKELKNLFKEYANQLENDLNDNDDTCDFSKSSELLKQLENNLPFKDEEEHAKWLDILFSYKFWEDFQDFTFLIIERKTTQKKVNPIEKQNSFKNAFNQIEQANKLAFLTCDTDFEMEIEFDAINTKCFRTYKEFLTHLKEEWATWFYIALLNQNFKIDKQEQNLKFSAFDPFGKKYNYNVVIRIIKEY